jgi:aminopeptidase N
MFVRLAPVLPVLILAGCAADRTAAPRAATAAPTAAVTPPAPPPLVSPEGIRLPRTFRPAAQRVWLTIVPSSPGFTGRTEIDGTLDTSAEVLWLNADAMEVATATARVGSEEVPAEPVVRPDQRVALRFPHPLPPGPVTLRLEFRGTQFTQEDSGIFRQQSGGDWYAFTQFEETDARRAFPCVDEPSAKIPWELTLRVPTALTAVANTPMVSETAAPDGMKDVRFRQTRPLPSYLVAFGVGPFDIKEARPAGKRRIPVRIVAPRGRAHEAAWAARVTPEILEGLEDYFGMAYPYDKLDVLPIPFTVQFGAMENVGLVTFREALVLAPTEQDRVQRRRQYALVAAHEFAHQWFGDVVTAAWWDDIWLNEAFATWMETKVIDRWAPAWGMAAERVEHRNGAADADALVNSRVIRQPVNSYNDVKNAFDAITYSKGAAVLRMFEQWVGPETFRRGIQLYVRTHADGNATAKDFLAAISQAAGRDVAPAFNTFLDHPGVPRVQASVRCGGQGGAVLRLAQDRWLPAGSTGDRAGEWQIPVCIRWSTKGREQNRCVLLDTPQTEVKLEERSCPDWVLPNAGYAGYYRLQLDPASRSKLVRAAKLDDAEKVGLLGDTAALVEGGAIPQAEGLQLAAHHAGAREHHVLQAAIKLATVREDFLAGRLGPAYQAWVRKTFGPHARALGFRPKPAEDDEVQLARPKLAEFVALRGEDPQLIAEARKLGEAWLARPRSVASEMVAPVLVTAGRFGGRDFHQALAQRLDRTQDTEVRDWILGGLAGTRAPELLDENMALATSGRLNPKEIGKVLLGGKYREIEPPLDSTIGRATTLAGVDRSWDTLVTLMPRGGLSRFFSLASQSCSQNERAEAERVFGPRVKSVLGGPRRFAISLERLDLCMAERSRDVPELERFFPAARTPRAATGG